MEHHAQTVCEHFGDNRSRDPTDCAIAATASRSRRHLATRSCYARNDNSIKMLSAKGLSVSVAFGVGVCSQVSILRERLELAAPGSKSISACVGDRLRDCRRAKPTQCMTQCANFVEKRSLQYNRRFLQMCLAPPRRACRLHAGVGLGEGPGREPGRPRARALLHAALARQEL
jgi:hypothetical protein